MITATNGKPSKGKSLSLYEVANEKHKAVRRGLRTTLNAARDAGEVLAKIRKQVGHGNWKPLFEGETTKFDFTIQTARKYIKIFEQWDLYDLGAKDITIEHACKVIKNFPDDDGEPETALESKKEQADKKPAKEDKGLVVSIDICKIHDRIIDLIEDAEKEDLGEFILQLLEEAIAAREAKV